MADWEQVETDLRWCLKEGRGVDGRDLLFEALDMADRERALRTFHNGFIMSYRDDPPVTNFSACEREDGLRLYNIGRSIIGLPPVT